MTIFIRNLVFS